MLRKYLRKFHYKYRFVPWYRKAYYYKCKKDKMDEIIAKYKEPEELADPKYVKKLKRDRSAACLNMVLITVSILHLDMRDRTQSIVIHSLQRASV